MITKLCIFTRPMLSQHLLAAMTAISITSALAYVRRDPIELLQINISDKVKPGMFIDELAEVDRKRSDCESVVHAEIVDGQTVHFKLANKDLPSAVSKGPTFIFRQYPIPFAAAWGKSQLIVQRTYFCWPFYQYWPIRRPVRELEFEIIPP